MGKIIIINIFNDNIRDFFGIIIPKEATPCNCDFAFKDLDKFIFAFFKNDGCRQFLIKYHDYSFVENVDHYFIENFKIEDNILYYFLEQAKLKNKKYNKELLYIVLSLSMLNKNKIKDDDFKKFIDLSLDNFDCDDLLIHSKYEVDLDYILDKMLSIIDSVKLTMEWNDIINYIFNDLLKQSYNPNSYHIVYYYFEYLYKQILYYREIKSMKTDFLYSDIVKLNKLLFDRKS